MTANLLRSTCFLLLSVCSASIPASCQSERAERPVAGSAQGGSKNTFALGVTRNRRLSAVHAIEKLDLGNFNLFHGNVRQAVQQYNAALQINSDLWEAHQGLCNCFVRLGKYKSAIKECHELLRLKPDHRETLFLLGSLLENQGKLNESIECLQKAKLKGLQSPELFTALGLAQAQNNQLEEALSNLDRAIALGGKKNSADTYLGRGLVFYKQGKREEALKELDLAIERRGGKFARARNLKADILYILGRTNEAKQEYLEEIQKEDPEPKCFQALGNILLKEGRISESRLIFEKGQKWYPRDAKIALGLAVALEHEGKPAQALKQYHRARDLLIEQKLPVTFNEHLRDLEQLEAAKRPDRP